jgi:Concanavalin A-like lectin/glucanases superfamily
MTTVTGLTADRMLAIEAASVVDGDVIGDNLILTKHDGTQINAGNVRGPQGAVGPVGQDLSVLAAAPILDVGVIGQIRAGRQLTAADFANMGLSAPLGLWNLSDLTDVSGAGRNLSNKNAIPFGPGINGLASTAAVFAGLPTQSLYIADGGTVADPFRIRTGSFGCWFRTAKSANQLLISKLNAAGTILGYMLQINPPSNVLQLLVSFAGSGWDINFTGISNVADDRWHFAVATFDGNAARIYVDGIFEAISIMNGLIYNANAGPFNIGTYGANAGTDAPAGVANYGRIDEAFITSDILSEDQIRNLYCAKIPHTLGVAPARISLNVHRRRKYSILAVGDFMTQPLRLHNFSAGSLGDEGSNGKPLTNNGPAVSVPSSDGTKDNAFGFTGAQSLSSHDGLALPAGEQLPSGLATRSYGCWFKLSSAVTTMGLISWGTLGTGDCRLWIFNNDGGLYSQNGGDSIPGRVVTDGQWHHAVVVEDNAPLDTVKRKLYLDGRLVGTSTVMVAVTLAGANKFRIGSFQDNTALFNGQIDSVFIIGYALTAIDIAKLYAKGTQDLGISPKNSGDHIERMDSTSLLAVFDTLETQHTVDAVIA